MERIAAIKGALKRAEERAMRDRKYGDAWISESTLITLSGNHSEGCTGAVENERQRESESERRIYGIQRKLSRQSGGLGGV